MNPILQPVTLDLSDELIAKLTLEAQAKGITLQQWVTILVKKAINELPANPTTQADDDADFNAEVFEREFAQAQSQLKLK
ncbi:MAG: hypothetical protein Q7K57_35915 [Burkholderiaceae bacterium]|nr:hypothetical protein [Burkholderiaceae bacterium]